MHKKDRELTEARDLVELQKHNLVKLGIELSLKNRARDSKEKKPKIGKHDFLSDLQLKINKIS
tara:strand:- start:186 stop:374 length:189 start_codon:yes stop_codon:yes gene_type:complete